MPYINVDSKNIYFEEYGNPNHAAIVYFHGGPGESCLSYTHQAKVLGEKYHMISFDQYGVFRSDALSDNRPFGVRKHVELIEKMRIALGIDSWTPLGHSYGGMLACLYAFMYPNRTDAVIYDCPLWNTLLTSKTVASATLPYFIANGMDEKVKLCKEILDSSIPQEAFDKVRSLEMDDGLRKFCHVIDNRVYNEYFTNFIPKVDVVKQDWYKYINYTKMLLAEGDFYDDYLHCLAEIKKPSLLIVGEYDMTCGKDQQEWFCEHSANGQFIVLEKSTHLSWVQFPQEYTDIIFKFMDGINNKKIV